MGYTTDFSGHFDLDKPLSLAHFNYLTAFAEVRHMKRDFSIEVVADAKRLAVGLSAGKEGKFYIGGNESASLIDYNIPPDDCPGLWCQWVPNEDGTIIQWDCNEKFYNYVEWIEFIIKYFLEPWGYILNGEVRWRGEEFDDIGTIICENNKVRTTNGFPR